MDERLSYVCSVAGIDWLPDGAAVTDPYRDPEAAHRWVAFIAGGHGAQPGLVVNRRGEVVLDATRPGCDQDCWVIPVHLTREQVLTLRALPATGAVD